VSDQPEAYGRETLPEEELRRVVGKKPRAPGFTPSKPTHRLRVKDNATGATGTVGAGWANPDGSVSVHLDPGCALSYDTLKGKVLTLFPIERSEP
jgi:hypothetical protein